MEEQEIKIGVFNCKCKRGKETIRDGQKDRREDRETGRQINAGRQTEAAKSFR